MAKNAKDSKDRNSKQKKGTQLTVEEIRPGGNKKMHLESKSDKMIHQLLPFIYVVLAILFAACFILTKISEKTAVYVGVVGNIISDIFFGLISWGTFLIPVLLVILAINWRRYVDSKIIVSKIIFPSLLIIFLPALIHVFVKQFSGNTELNLKITELWINGVALKSGGLLGGFFGELSYLGLNFVGSVIVLIPLVFIFFIFSLGMTPRNMMIFLRYRKDVRAEKTAEKRKKQEEIKKENKLRKEQEEKQHREKLEAMRIAEQERIRAEKEAEEKRIALAEKRAAEIEEEEKKKVQEEASVIKIPPLIQSEPKPMPVNPLAEEMPEHKAPAAEAPEEQEDDGRIDLEQIFSEPPSNYSKAPKNPLVDESNDSKEDALEIEMKPITDIEGVPDDGDEGQIDDTPAFVEYKFPPVDLLKQMKSEEDEEAAHKELVANAQRLMETLKSFNVRVQEINYSRGPTITRYEIKPDVGVRIRSIANLVDDIALSLATTGVRIEAPIPNKAAVGVEVPNKNAAIVSLRSLIETTDFSEKKSRLTACLGKDVGGNPIFFDVGKMPHMLIAGTTGSGKSVCINCIIMSLLYKASPNDLKLILIDPKKVEFNIYKNIPHLYCPIVSDPKKAAGALASAVAEMERRFELIEEVGARDIAGYNSVTAEDPTKEHLPYMVIIIDELADLMMTAADDVETAICRIAQKARAAGIHLIVGTQRPSTDVITGLIKSNIPSRIAFAVASQIDSRTILDGAGAEKLIGRGDMLFSPLGVTKPLRVQGAFVSDSEVERIVEFLKDNNDSAQFDDTFMRRMEEEAAKCGNKKGAGSAAFDEGEAVEEGGDPKFKAAVDVAIEMGKISTSLLQRRLEIGYGRAAKIIDRMEALGYVSAADGNKPRQVLVSKMELMEKRVNDEIE